MKKDSMAVTMYNSFPKIDYTVHLKKMNEQLSTFKESILKGEMEGESFLIRELPDKFIVIPKVFLVFGTIIEKLGGYSNGLVYSLNPPETFSVNGKDIKILYQRVRANKEETFFIDNYIGREGLNVHFSKDLVSSNENTLFRSNHFKNREVVGDWEVLFNKGHNVFYNPNNQKFYSTRERGLLKSRATFPGEENRLWLPIVNYVPLRDDGKNEISYSRFGDEVYDVGGNEFPWCLPVFNFS
jgi:hypothetical protein